MIQKTETQKPVWTLELFWTWDFETDSVKEYKASLNGNPAFIVDGSDAEDCTEVFKLIGEQIHSAGFPAEGEVVTIEVYPLSR